MEGTLRSPADSSRGRGDAPLDGDRQHPVQMLLRPRFIRTFPGLLPASAAALALEAAASASQFNWSLQNLSLGLSRCAFLSGHW